LVLGAGAPVHGFYTELERLFLRVARELGGIEARGEGWHTTLLTEMTLNVKGVRPPVLGSELRRRLHEYLRFRHLFRHLYVLELEPAELFRLLEPLPGLWRRGGR
jgi:hypothetical protein